MRANEFLTEDRNSFVADQLGDNLLQAYEEDNGAKPQLESPLDIVIELSKASPKLVQWLANRYIGGEFKLEDLEMIKAGLTRFIQVRARLPDEQKDLNKLSLSALYGAIAPFEDKEVVSNKKAAKNKKEKFFNDGEAELLYKDSTLVVVTPKTKAASCYFGIGAKWCTSSSIYKNEFDNYNKKGSLYIIMTKDDGKFQLHMEKKEFNNALNDALPLKQIYALIKKYPKLLDVFDSRARDVGYYPLIKNPSKELQLMALSMDPEGLKLVEHPSEELQLAAIYNKIWSIKYINNPTEKVQLQVVNSHGEFIRYIKNPSEAVQLAAAIESPFALEHIKNPSLEVQETAARNDGYALKFIKNPSEELKLAVVKKQGKYIEHIKNPSEKVQLAAIHQDPSSILWIRPKASEKMKRLAIKLKPSTITWIHDPGEKLTRYAIKLGGWEVFKHISRQDLTVAIQLDAMRHDGLLLQHIGRYWQKNEVKVAAIKQNVKAFHYAGNPNQMSDEVLLATVEQKPHYIKYVSRPSMAVQLAAIKKSPDTIQYISKPAVAAQVAAVTQDKNLINMINNPSAKAIKAAGK